MPLELVVPTISIPEGILITCPKCSVEIAEIKRTIFKGQRLEAADVKGIREEMVLGKPTTCDRCGMSWFFNGRLHTEFGWLPS
mgnify:CR=1 FL=1